MVPRSPVLTHVRTDQQICGVLPELSWRDQLAAVKPPQIGLWLAGNEGLEKNMEITIVGYIWTTIRIHSFISS